MSIRGAAAIVGVGTTEYYKRGRSPFTLEQLVCKAIITACEDAGIDAREIDGFTSFSELTMPHVIAPTLGIPEMRYSAQVWGGGGGGSCAAVGNAVSAIMAGYANVVVLYHAMRRTDDKRPGGAGALANASPWCLPYGLITPAQQFSMMVRRHMYEFGTTYEHLGMQAISQRSHAIRNPLSMMKSELTMDEYLAARMIADPFRLFDCTMENDGAAAMIITSAERAKDLRQQPAMIAGVSQGGRAEWGHALADQSAPPDLYSTAGHATIAKNLYAAAGLGPSDVDVAQLYDHFSGMVLLEMEDYGLCGRGESGPFVASGATTWPNGSVPVNTSGGNISEVNLHGTTHIIEAVRQIRGTSTSQVDGAEVSLVTGGPSPLPSSSMILTRSER
jgi:acetyl-CoA acetyltransferase